MTPYLNPQIKVKEEQIKDYLSFLNKPYQNVASSRTFNTTYTNNKDYPIQVIVSLDFTASTTYRQVNIWLDGSLVGTEYLQGGNLTNYRDIRNVYFIVAPGQTYRLDIPSSSGLVEIYRWNET